MNRRVILSSLIVLMMIGGGVMYWADTQKSYYTPRTETEEAYGYRGGMEYLRQLRANPKTGRVHVEDILKARRQLEQVRSKNKKSALNLDWNSIGPNNIGGRTRGILIDNQDPNTMYAGSVSGGLFKSTNGGRSWNPVFSNAPSLSVTDIAQASNGDLYFSTGESLYIGLGFFSGTPAFIGSGIYKSTDGGNTFSVLPNTRPSGGDWLAIGKLAIDPNNDQIIYAATNNGLRKSTDGGQSWTNPISGLNSGATDLFMTPSGTLYVSLSNQILKSSDGTNFTEVTCRGFGCPRVPRTSGRMRVAVAPQDEDYVYVVTTKTSGQPGGVRGGLQFDKLYRSTDGGNTFTELQESSIQLNPHGTQGRWNNALIVDPANKDRVFIGGVTFWEWSESGGMQQLALTNEFTRPLYVHADNHELVFHPNDSNKFFIGNDGGVFKSNNSGSTFSEENAGYSTTQFYAFDIGGNGEVLGGTQDNGCILIDQNRGLPKNGVRTPPVATPTGAFFSGDGGYTAVSQLDPDVSFVEYQYARMGRSVDGGQTYEDIYDPRMHPDSLTPGGATLETYGNGAFHSFITPFLLHEDRNDEFSTDSIVLEAKLQKVSLGFGTNVTSYSGRISRPRSQADFVVDSFKVVAGQQVVRSDASGNLSGDGTGTFDPNTGAFNVDFNNPTNKEVVASVDIMYPAGSVITLISDINEIPLKRTLQNDLMPRESIAFQDPVQSIFIMGLQANKQFTGGPVNPRPPFSDFDKNETGGIWMTRGALSNLELKPEWWHIGKLGRGVEPSALAMSEDGDILYVGTNRGRLYRFSNIKNARDSASASVDDRYVSEDSVIPNSSVIQRDILGGFNGRYISGIEFDKRDKSRLIVTLANYGTGDHVYYTDRADSPSLTVSQFEDKSGDLPNVPVYSALFNYTDEDGSEVIIGTDQGIFTTDDIEANSVSWTNEINGIPTVPVFDLKQDLILQEGLPVFGGAVYAATHGRGYFRTNSTEAVYQIGTREEELQEPAVAERGLRMYPNPASGNVSVKVDLENRSDVRITLRNIAGQLVRESLQQNIQPGTTELNMNLEGIKPGAYLISTEYGGERSTGKLIVK